MAKFVYGLSQSLDGYVNHDAFAPGPLLFRHFVDRMHSVSASLYGRHLYELMRYWEQDDPDWPADRRAFAQAWRDTPKWIVSTTLTSVGPNATLISAPIEPALRQLKADTPGEIEVGGTVLAQSLAELNLIDEYRIYLRPIILGPNMQGKPFFAAAVPPYASSPTTPSAKKPSG